MLWGGFSCVSVSASAGQRPEGFGGFSTSRSHRGRHVLRTGCAGRKLRLSPTPSPKAPPPAPLFDAVSCFDFGCYSDAAAAATALLVRGFAAPRRQRRRRTLSASSYGGRGVQTGARSPEFKLRHVTWSVQSGVFPGSAPPIAVRLPPWCGVAAIFMKYHGSFERIYEISDDFHI